MSALALLDFDGRPFRTVERDGEPWFVAADVCAALGLQNPAQAVSKLDEDEKGINSTDTLGGAQSIYIINESGLYTLMLRCREATKPGTVPYRFRKWVTGEVLPRLRKGETVALAAQPETRIVLGANSEDLAPAIAVIREARQVFGKAAARQLWKKLGLPAPDLPGELLTRTGGIDLSRIADPGMQEWLVECIVVDGHAPRIGTSDLHRHYVGWCEGAGHVPLTVFGFGHALTRAGVAGIHSNGSWRTGVRLAA
jgi:prophage antirepressor-like protein